MIAGLMMVINKCNAQDTLNNQQWNKDQLFPSKGKASLFISTGIPFFGAGEYSYGFTNKFSVGAIYARSYGQMAPAYGIRFRGIIYSSSDNFRIYGELPILFYPKTTRLESWVLAYPEVMFEKKFSSGLRIALGAGLPGAACADFLLTGHDEAHIISSDTRKSVFTLDGGFMGGVWYTINSGISFPIANKIMFTERFDVVANGVNDGSLHAKNWFYKPQVITFIGLTFAL